MSSRYVEFKKQLLRAALEPYGSVELDVEVPGHTRPIDLWFTPHGARADAPDPPGWLGPIADPALPTSGDQALVMDTRMSSKPGAGRRSRKASGKGGRKASGKGECSPLLWTCLVVVNELPVERDTLLLRILGAGAVLRQATAELQALPAEAPERTLALPVLLRLRLAMPNDPALQTRDDQEFLMDTQDVVEAWRREAIQEGVRQGLEQGVRQGLEQGVRQGLEQGVRQGLEQGERKLLLCMLRERFGNQVDADTERRVEEASVAQMEAWAKRAFLAATLEELLNS